MADRYDPKVTVRPATDRKESNSRQGSASSDDPLFELARIVSGRGVGAAPGGSSPPSRGRPAPPPEPARPATAEPDILGDLEAELLSDLQSSFAAIRGATESVRPEPPSAPVSPPQPPVAAAPPPAQPGRPPQPEPVPQQPTSPPVHAAPPPPHAAPPPPRAALPQNGAPQSPAAPVQAPAAAPSQPSARLSGAARPPIQQAPPRQPSAAPPPRTQPYAPTPASAGPAAPKKLDVGHMNLRPTAAPEVRVTAAPPVPPERPASAAARPSRWDKPAEPPRPQASAASRFAPPRAAGHRAAPPPAPPPSEDEDLPFGEGVPFAHEGEDAADEFPLDAFDIVPGYGDDAEVPPYPDDDLEPLRKRGVPRSLVAIASILALVLIGVLAFVVLRPGSSGSGAPPIISADAGPTKIAPPEPPSTAGGDQQNKLIYDRVDSAPSGAPADTKLVTPGSEPIAPVPSTDTSNPIARIIAPGAPGSETPGAADTGGDAQSIGPRKVRTVVVRPDGTIVSSDAAPAPGDAPASTDAVPMPAPPATAEVPTVPPPSTKDDTAAIAGGTGGHELAITPNPGADNPAETPAPPAAVEPHTAAAPPTPKPTPPKVVATGGDGGPIDLTPGASGTEVASRTPAAPGAAAPLAAGGMMVQVSSQRSEDAARATYRDLQARYPGILGGYDANIQRADLGDRGIYFRVRVGPFASTNAQSLCTALKNAGGDCILTR